MKAISALFISLAFTASSALATGAASEGRSYGLMTECLIAFFVTIFLFQFVPGITLLVGAVKGIFAPDSEKLPAGSQRKL
jgi:hypothetical protein